MEIKQFLNFLKPSNPFYLTLEAATLWDVYPMQEYAFVIVEQALAVLSIMSEITAKLKKVIWRSVDNDFTIAAFSPEKTGPEFIATGDLFKPSAGITYEMAGKWEEHAKYGKQFKIDSYCVRAPVDSESIAIYLEKHVTGIGPVMADVLIEKYGERTIKKLKKCPELVSDEIKGLSYDVALKISEQLQEGDKRQDILIQLEGMLAKVKGLPKKLAANLLSMYGRTAFEVVKNNPYVLTRMNRVGFLLADKVAMASGVKIDDPERIKQGIIYVIKQTMQETGDVWLQPSKIVHEASNLNIKNGVAIGIKKLIDDKTLVGFGLSITLTQFAKDENLIADCVVRFLT